MVIRLTTHSAALLGAGLLAACLVGCSKPVDTVTGAAPAASGASTTVGTEIDDSVVTATVKSALLADPDVKSLSLSVETRKGEVQLSGFADSQNQLDRAAAVTKGVAGVKSVDNKLALKNAPTTIGNKVDDGILTTRVKAALLSDTGVKGMEVNVASLNGQVQLSGFVDSPEHIERAVQLARGVDGVSSVTNEMTVKK